MLVGAEFGGSLAICRPHQHEASDRTAYQIMNRAILEMQA